MTVMVLQRSVTSQSTQSQKTGKKANRDCSAKPPILFLLDDRQEHRRSTDTALTTTTTTTTTTTNVLNNNNNENNNSIDIADIVNLNNNNNNNNNKEKEKQKKKKKKEVEGNSVVRGDGSVDRCSSREYILIGVDGGEEAPSSVTSQRRPDGGEDVAMRYYRLWIYACNVVLLGSAVGFAAAVSRTLLFTGDPRRHVVPGVPRAFDPTALYAYLALATQLGLVQLLGCIAARRLSAKLLNAYWILLLALLFGDAVIGVAWVFRFEKMRADLRPALRLRLQMDYGKEARFSEQWDRLQREFACCGVTGPRDFGGRWPQSCCAVVAAAAAATVTGNVNGSDVATGSNGGCQQPFARGCEESLTRWLRKTADLLFVLGFCVIAFAKLCFLGILRYEIREMIQKIRFLREPPPPATPFALPPFSQVLPETAANNGSIAPPLRRTTLTNAPLTPSGNASLLLQQEECNAGRHPLLANSLQQDGGADSDTNSHCALILEETTPTSTTNHNCNSGGGGGGGGASSGARCEKSNGNNNYEMREFNRHLLLSNGGSPGTGLTTAFNAAHATRRT